MLRLPLSAVVLATLLTAKSGLGAMPLVIVGVVVAYVITTVLSGLGDAADPAAAARSATAGSRRLRGVALGGSCRLRSD